MKNTIEKDKFLKYCISKNSTIISAMHSMDTIRTKLLIVVDNNNLFLGLLSIGDIQRALLKGISTKSEISKVIRNDYIVAKPEDSRETISKIMLTIRAEFMPVVNQFNEIIDVIFWEDIFGNERKIPIDQFNLPVVIMAGGFGTRVQPLSHVFPKPLLPYGNKTILEEILYKFNKHGCNEFYISLNYKAELIEFFLNQRNLPYNIEFIKEQKPLGTAGSLYLLKNKINSTFFVSNCDIIIDQDYAEILKYHQESQNEITIVSAIRILDIPYGILITGKNGSLKSLSEKPSFTFQINSGMYLLEPTVFDDILENEYFHITELIEKILHQKRKVGVFPVSEKSWQDIGNLNDYIKIIMK